MFRDVFVPVLPWEIASRRHDRDGRLRLRGLSAPGSSACSRSRWASTSCCCARCSRARRTRRRSSAAPTSSTSATRACSGCCWRRSRCAIPSAARHAAAVAHYAHQLARAAGLSEREQAIVHTAGPAARPRQGGAARPHPDRPRRAASGRAAADPAPSRRRRAPAAARRGHGRGRRGRARPPRAHRRQGLPGRAVRRRHPDDRADPRRRRGLRRADGAGLLQDPDGRRRGRGRAARASPAPSSTGGSCGCSPPRCCAASTPSTSSTSPTSRPSCRSSARVRGALDGPFVLGPGRLRDEALRHPADGDPPRQQPEADQQREVVQVAAASKPNTASRTSSTRW